MDYEDVRNTSVADLPQMQITVRRKVLIKSLVLVEKEDLKAVTVAEAVVVIEADLVETVEATAVDVITTVEK